MGNIDEAVQGKWLLDAMQDNSCWLSYQVEEHPRQKPKRSYCFNSHGRIPYGQGHAQRCRPQRLNMTGRHDRGASIDTLNDISMPDEFYAQINSGYRSLKLALDKAFRPDSEVSEIIRQLTALHESTEAGVRNQDRIHDLRDALYVLSLIHI